MSRRCFSSTVWRHASCSAAMPAIGFKPCTGQNDIGAVRAGFVISLLGFALAYAQLVPVPCKTTREAYDLREAQATDIQKQVLRCSGCSSWSARDGQHCWSTLHATLR